MVYWMGWMSVWMNRLGEARKDACWSALICSKHDRVTFLFFLGSSLDAKKPLQDFNRDPMMPSAPMTKSTSFPRAEWGSSSSSSSSSAGGTQTNNSNSSNNNSKPPLTRPTTAHPRSRVEVQQASQHQNAADQFLEPPAGARQLTVRPTTAHPRSQSDEHKVQSGESPRIVGGAAAPPRAGAKCRPLSAMANMSRGQASTSEKVKDSARRRPCTKP
jgi:hypothetical protein